MAEVGDRQMAMGALTDALAHLMGAGRADRHRRSKGTEDLSQTHLRALFLLLQEGEATAGALARAAHLNPASVTAMVDQLQVRGLVERRRHAADRRVCLVALTPPGQAVVSAQQQRRAARLEGLLDGIPDAELRAATRVLARLASLLDDGGTRDACCGDGSDW
jgi:DNA-binding MarR family transcriptional regulator